MRPAPPRGLTLVELCATLLVASVALALALPAMADLQDRVRRQAALHALTASLAGARIAAVGRGRPVTACPSRDGRRCRDDLDWRDGWIVYVDPDRRPQPASPADILQHAPPLPRGLALWSSPGRHRVRFQPDGMAGGSNVSLRLCSAGAAPRQHATVTISLSGRTRTRPSATPAPACLEPASAAPP